MREYCFPIIFHLLFSGNEFHRGHVSPFYGRRRRFLVSTFVPFSSNKITLKEILRFLFLVYRSFVAVSEVYLKNYFDKSLSGALADQVGQPLYFLAT